VGYFAPETVSDQVADPRSDIFSFCVTLWRSLYGTPPFPCTTINEYVRAICDEGPPDDPGDTSVPVWLGEIARKGLHANPRQRHASMEELLHALEEADPDRPRAAVGDDGARGDIDAFELTFRSKADLVTLVRQFVSEFYDRVIGDADATSRIALATHELLENAVKYARSEETRLLVEVDRGKEPPALAIRTWNTASDEDIAAIERTLARMKAREDPDAYYHEQMRASLERDRCGLGLARICAEGEMVLSCEREGNRLCIIARTRASKSH
jgi:anti-sigma regulatory factor (Ser/Thr protein kinase)